MVLFFLNTQHLFGFNLNFLKKPSQWNNVVLFQKISVGNKKPLFQHKWHWFKYVYTEHWPNDLVKTVFNRITFNLRQKDSVKAHEICAYGQSTISLSNTFKSAISSVGKSTPYLFKMHKIQHACRMIFFPSWNLEILTLTVISFSMPIWCCQTVLVPQHNEYLNNVVTQGLAMQWLDMNYFLTKL